MVSKLPARAFILLHEDVSISTALLMRDILAYANRLTAREAFAVRLVGPPGLQSVGDGVVSVRVGRASGTADHLLVPPMSPASDPFRRRDAATRLISRLHARGAVVHAACLGSLLVAQSGLLDGREATTHWNWVTRAAERFPDVHWDAARMLCDTRDIVTAGGFLAAVDLTLALVERVCSRAVSREVGRLLLADSVRQHQSVYATTLVPASADPRMQRLERWLKSHLSSAVTVEQMAEICRMPPRTFHRAFVGAFGVTPKKYVQLKRIETVRNLLREPLSSVEEAIASVGVSDVPSFRKVFQREMGMSPAEYRRKMRDETR